MIVKAEQFFVFDDKRFICGLNEGQSIHVFGIADLLVYKGAVNVLGAIRRSSDTKVQIFSPRSTSFLGIIGINESNDSEYSGELSQYQCVFEIMACPEHPLFGLETFSSHVSNGNLFAQLLKPSNIPISPPGIGQRAPCIPGLYVFDPKDPWYGDKLKELKISGFFGIPPCWQSTIQEICSLTEKGGTPKVVVCGDRKVGKSTFTRYLVNSTLNTCPKVIHVDLDVGQTEFTPPSFISACILENPITGTPFCHQRIPDVSCYFGSMSPGDNVGHFFACFKEFFKGLDTFLNRHNIDAPIIINTMGWITGLGFDMLQFTLQLCAPSHVISLTNPPTSESDDFISAAFHTKCRVDYSVKPIVHKVNVSYIAPIVGPFVKSVFSPSDLRNILYTTYFHGRIASTVLDGFDITPLTSMQPFSVKWSDITVIVCGKMYRRDVPPAMLNGSIVGLATERSPLSQSYGLGLIRAIDPIQQLYYVLTPLPLTILKNVKTFLLGTNCTIPYTLLLEDKQYIDSTPYLSCEVNCDAAGSAVHRARHSILRKSHGDLST